MPAPNIPILSGPGAGYSLSLSDQSQTNPILDANQSGGSQTAQITAAQTIWPFAANNRGGNSMVLALVVFAVFGVAAFFILKKS
jgi:hypothetical protein